MTQKDLPDPNSSNTENASVKEWTAKFRQSHQEEPIENVKEKNFKPRYFLFNFFFYIVVSVAHFIVLS